MALTIVAVVLLGMALVVYNEYTTTAPMPPDHTGKSPMANSAPAVPSQSDTSDLSTTKPVEQAEVEEKKDEPMAQAEVTAPAETMNKDTKEWGASAPLAPEPVVEESEYRHPALQPPSIAGVLEERENLVANDDKAEQKSEPAKSEQAIAKQESSKLDASKQEVAKVDKPNEVKPASPKPSQNTAKEVRKITVSTIGDGVTVRIDSVQRPDYTSLRLNNPERIVLDFEGIWKVKAPGVPNNEFVSNVRIGVQKKGTRIVIDLKKSPASIRYLKYGDTGLDVRIR